LILDNFKDIRDRFEKLAKLPEDSVDLTSGALLIARTSYPQVDETTYRQYLEALAERLKSRLSRDDQPIAMLDKLNRVIFSEEGFRGNQGDYFDPDNSFLNRVIDRKLGIPITLSLLYIIVGRAAGMNLHGIALPGHFMAALFQPSETILLDPFNKAKILSDKEYQTIANSSSEHPDKVNRYDLTPAKPKDILVRMLRNLKAIYFHSNNDLKTFEMLHWILILKPNAAKERLERGLRYEAMGNGDRAINDFEQYLKLTPNLENTLEIETKIEQLKKQTTWIH
jgi:regulator of sirC expression with transglutaminase-like and TPR domain